MRRTETGGARATGGGRHAHGEVRQVWKRDAGARPHSVEGRIGEARLRKCFEGSLEALDRALKDGDERISAESAGSEFAKGDGRADGAIFLWRRGEAA